MSCTVSQLRLGETTTCTLVPLDANNNSIYSLATDFSIAASPSVSQAVLGSLSPAFGNSLSFDYTGSSAGNESGPVSLGNGFSNVDVEVSGRCLTALCVCAHNSPHD